MKQVMSTDVGQWKHPSLLAFSVKSILIVWKIFKYFKHRDTPEPNTKMKIKISASDNTWSIL